MRQCMDGTNNRALCSCVLRVFKRTVPVEHADLRHHGPDKVRILNVSRESLANMLPGAHACEERFDQGDD